MKKSKFVLLLVLSSVLVFSSCSKEQGCTDADSVNYSITAEEDDGSCSYEGKMVFWFGKTLADSASYYGYTELFYYVDGKFVGSGSLSTYWDGAPECGQDGSSTVTKDLGKDKSKKFLVLVKANGIVNGTTFTATLDSSMMEFTANTCIKQELSW